MRIPRLAIAASMVLAPSLTAQPAPRWSLTVAVHAGDKDGPPLTDVRGLAASPGGGVYVLDVKTQEVLLYDANGGFVRRVARRGRGPGEMQNALGMARLPSGGFVINDDANARLTFWSANGEYQRQVQLSSSFAPYAWVAGWADSAHLVDQTLVRIGGAFEPKLRRINTSTGLVDTLPSPNCAGPNDPAVRTFFGRGGRGPGMMIPFLGVQRRVVDDAGMVWCSPGGTYRVDQYRIGTTRATATIARPSALDTIPSAARA